jgi:glyoxylase-like metal-dependent hydrolase (beta-lactamase superfamily II)
VGCLEANDLDYLSPTLRQIATFSSETISRPAMWVYRLYPLNRPFPKFGRVRFTMHSVIPGVYQISHRIVNSFVIDGDEGVTLIDTGLPRLHRTIVTALPQIGRSVTDIAALVLTHSHRDHTGGAAHLKASSGAPVYASASDSAAIRGDEPIPTPPVTEQLQFLKPLFNLLPNPEPVDVEHTVAEGATNDLPADLRVVETPGHTPGHVSYLLEREGGLLIVGDAAVVKRGEIKLGWLNRGQPACKNTIRHIAEYDFDTACFGHSDPLRPAASDGFRTLAEILDAKTA